MQFADDPNAAIIAEFRANGGVVEAPYDDPPPMVLLHTIGRKTGKEHIVPMRAMERDGALYVFASAHGKASHPDWYYNIVENPEIVIEIGPDTVPVHATDVTGPERDAIFALQRERFPVFARYERELQRTIPVIRLDRRDH